MLLITHGDLLEEMLRVSLAHAPLSWFLSKISADSVAGWDQLALDFAPGLLPRADKWSQLISSDFFFLLPRAYPRQSFRSSSKIPSLGFT